MLSNFKLLQYGYFHALQRNPEGPNPVTNRHTSAFCIKGKPISDSSDDEINTETFPEKSCRFFYAFTASISCKKSSDSLINQL